MNLCLLSFTVDGNWLSGDYKTNYLIDCISLLDTRVFLAATATVAQTNMTVSVAKDLTALGLKYAKETVGRGSLVSRIAWFECT